MGITRKADKSALNIGHGEEAAAWSNNCFSTTTGNANNKYLKFNNTYTLEKGKLEGNLLSYDEVSYHKKEDLKGIETNASDTNAWYYVWGHPDKFQYDYSQKYNNCGVDSALNVLAMAGKFNVFENNDEYKEQANVKIGEKIDPMTGITPIYSTPVKGYESEDILTLWAIQNERCEHINDTNTYKKPSNIQDKDGGTYTTNTHAGSGYENVYQVKLGTVSNILTENGVKASDIQAYIEDLGITLTKIENNDENNEEKQEQTEADKEREKEVEELKKVYEEEQNLNKNKYGFSNQLIEYVKDGRGIIIGGNANALRGTDTGKYAGHAITIVGALEVSTIVGKDTRFEYGTTDILGFYVIDTGGWLPITGSAQYVEISKLYDFFTDFGRNTIEYEEDFTSKLPSMLAEYYTATAKRIIGGTYICVTDEEIRSWADKLNMNGNNNRNVLRGNKSENILDGKNDSDVLYGHAGNDSLIGGNGYDTLIGGTGDDTLVGGAGNDTYKFGYQNNDIITKVDDSGSHGNDIIKLSNDCGADKLWFAQTKFDEIEVSSNIGDMVLKYTNYSYINEVEDDGLVEKRIADKEAGTVTVKNFFSNNWESHISHVIDENSKYLITNGDVARDKNGSIIWDTSTIKSITEFLYSKAITVVKKLNVTNKLTGTKYHDAIIAGNKNDTITAGAGNDTITGVFGNNIIKAGAGNDVIFGSLGSDKIYLEKGDNKVYYTKEAYSKMTPTKDFQDMINFGYSGNDTIYAGSGNDTIILNDVNDFSEVACFRTGNNLILKIDNKGNSITFANYYTTKNSNVLIGINGFDGNSSNINTFKSLATIASGASTYSGNIKGSGKIDGNFGNDTIMGSAGNDEIKGDYGDDKMYGYAGVNKYVYEKHAQGCDTIYSQNNSSTILDFSATDIKFNQEGTGFNFIEDLVKLINNYKLEDTIYQKPEYDNVRTFTKSGNNLIINYATSIDEIETSKITLANYFTTKNTTYKIVYGNNKEFDLSNATVYFAGNKEKKNTITGSKQNDNILGGDLNDTIKAGNGDDIIEGGKGNDNITGGTGKNTIIYNLGDGTDTINVSKNEELIIKTNLDENKIEYVKSGNNLEIYNRIDEKTTEKVLILKNFTSSDVTASAILKFKNGETDLRKDIYYTYEYIGKPKSYNYTGTWLSEKIDASKIQTNKGANINAGAGDDYIIGSINNDTIKGGSGNDIIVAGAGKNTVDGGNGSDTYYLFGYEDKNSADSKYKISGENTTINDTGKNTGDTDRIVICLSDSNVKNLDLQENGTYEIKIKIANNNMYPFSNIDVKQKGEISNEAHAKGIEEIDVKVGNTIYKFNSNQLMIDIQSFLSKQGFSSIDAAYKDPAGNMIINQTINTALGKDFSDASYWTQQV